MIQITDKHPIAEAINTLVGFIVDQPNEQARKILMDIDLEVYDLFVGVYKEREMVVRVLQRNGG